MMQDGAAPSTFYELLGLDKNATNNDIRSAYRRLQRTVHPDVVGPAANPLAILLNAAIDMLCNPVSR